MAIKKDPLWGLLQSSVAVVKLPQTEENDEIINQADITTLDYDKRYGNYRLRINEKELGEKLETIKKLIFNAKENFG